MTKTFKTDLISDLETVTLCAIKDLNEYITDFRIYGRSLQDYKNTMNTADFTKFFQYIVNDAIEDTIKNLGIDARREQVSGYDYVFGDTPVEFKLMGGDSKASFATGNKTSHFGGAKTNIVWTIKYTFNDNQIDSFGMVVIDTNLTESNVWKSSSGRKDSFSTIELLVGEENCILSQIGIVRPATKKLHFLPLPTQQILPVDNEVKSLDFSGFEKMRDL